MSLISREIAISRSACSAFIKILFHQLSIRYTRFIRYCIAHLNDPSHQSSQDQPRHDALWTLATTTAIACPTSRNTYTDYSRRDSNRCEGRVSSLPVSGSSLKLISLASRGYYQL
ncbi:MAG: hypothetical protein HC795_18240 [Coleofasciculaceae cyanobacterium RL_1_1]|nr:hypothetical protein [Coleofasciculaceae cyanobacterium RL_1_1]